MAKLKKIEEKVKEAPKPQYRPGANYQWAPDAEFTLSGAEYELLFNALKANFQNPEFQAHVAQFQAYKMLENVFLQGVEEGVITEIPEEAFKKAPPEDPSFINDKA